MSNRAQPRFFLPGPTWVVPEVYEALSRPVVGHRSAELRATYERCAEGLRALFRTSGDVLVATGSATLLMQAALQSTVGERVLHLTNGAFSERWVVISEALGLAGDRVAVPWGQPVDADLVRRALRRGRYEAVTLAHNETSTGVLSPLAEIAQVVRQESAALLLVDAVSSLGGAPLETDAWQLDVVITASQKAMALPPGLAFCSLSSRAADRASRIVRRGFYTDLLRYREEHRKGGTITTPAVSLLWALERQLERIAEEGVERRWERHRRLAERVAQWAESRGIELASSRSARSPTITCLRPPPEQGALAVVAAVAAAGFTIASGYGAWKNDTFRIGHMGDLQLPHLDPLLAVLDDVCRVAPAASH